MSLSESMRRAVKSNFGLASLYYLSSECAARVLRSAGHIESESGSAHHGRTIEESLEYIRTVFADYKQYGGVSSFHGKVAEVGPGDNCGVALLLLNNGCESADLVDRFYTRRSPAAQSQIYRALINGHPELATRLAHADLKNDESFPGIRRWYGPSAAAEVFFRDHSGYDFIVSRAVLEHLYDPIGALAQMVRALNPGGTLLHKIDLRDHGMYSRGFHELKFLELPDWIYPWMTRSSGRPNRVLVNQYRDCLQGLNVEYELLVTRLAGVGNIEPHTKYEQIPRQTRAVSLKYVQGHRHRFAPSFQRVSDEDLSIAGVFLVAKRPLRHDAAPTS
jgi:SAM-dependent methyltransferase